MEIGQTADTISHTDRYMGMVLNKAFLLLQGMAYRLIVTGRLGQHAVAYKSSLSYRKKTKTISNYLLSQNIVPTHRRRVLAPVQKKCNTVHFLGVGLPDKITYNPQKMLCILVSCAYFNHSTKCNKLQCLSS